MADIPTFEVFCSDPQLLGEPISPAWVDFYNVMEGRPVVNEELVRQCTGRDHYMPRVYTEATGICGRRSEKTSTALKFLIWKALFAGWERHGSWLRRAARTTRRLRIPLIAQDMRVVHDLKRTAEALIVDSPVISNEIAEIRVSEIVFRNGVSLICLPASKASVRGFTCPACLLDELAWVSIEGADDHELVRSVKPSMIQFGASRRLIKLSTPWLSDSGVIAEDFMHRAERPEVLVWQASTQVMTPRIDPAELERERIADGAYFAREYLAEFSSSDLEAFLPPADIAAATCTWRELAPTAESYYVAALDASGLSGGDTFTFAIAHADDTGGTVVLLRGWRRAAVPMVMDEISSLCRAYRIANIVADQYSFSFVAELLRQRDIQLEQLTFSARSKPELYFDLKNALSHGRFHLPTHPEMLRELRALQSLRTTGGGYRIGAPRGMHGDYPTVLALLANKIKRSESVEPMICVLNLNDRETTTRTAEELRAREREREAYYFSRRRATFL